MTSYNSMKKKLEPLGIYDIKDGTEINLELKVYADELDRIFDKLNEMTKECFIPTAETYGIINREEFISKEKSNLSLEKRRELLISAEKITGIDATPEGFNEFLRSCGLADFLVRELFTSRRINLIIHDALNNGEKKLLEQRVNAYAPAHIDVNFTYRTT